MAERIISLLLEVGWVRGPSPSLAGGHSLRACFLPGMGALSARLPLPAVGVPFHKHQLSPLCVNTELDAESGARSARVFSQKGQPRKHFILEHCAGC